MNDIEKILETKEKLDSTREKIASLRTERKKAIEYYESAIMEEETKLKELMSLCIHEIILSFEMLGRDMGKCLSCGAYIPLDEKISASPNLIDTGIIINDGIGVRELINIITDIEELMMRLKIEKPNITFEELRLIITEEIQSKKNKR